MLNTSTYRHVDISSYFNLFWRRMKSNSNHKFYLLDIFLRNVVVGLGCSWLGQRSACSAPRPAHRSCSCPQIENNWENLIVIVITSLQGFSASVGWESEKHCFSFSKKQDTFSVHFLLVKNKIGENHSENGFGIYFLPFWFDHSTKVIKDSTAYYF